MASEKIEEINICDLRDDINKVASELDAAGEELKSQIQKEQSKQRERSVKCRIFEMGPDSSTDETLITKFLSDKEFVSAFPLGDEKIVIFYKDKDS